MKEYSVCVCVCVCVAVSGIAVEGLNDLCIQT